MSRSGYGDYCDGWDLIRWRGAVTSAIKGKRGQAFLKEMLVAMESLPEKKLIGGDLVTPQGEVCALGSVALARGLDTSKLDIYDAEGLAEVFGIAPALAREIEYMNDEHFAYWGNLSPEKRFDKMKSWILENIK